MNNSLLARVCYSFSTLQILITIVSRHLLLALLIIKIEKMHENEGILHDAKRISNSVSHKLEV